MIMVPAKPSVLARMATPRRYTDRGYLASVAGDLYGGSVRTDPDWVAAAMHARSGAGSARGYLYQLAPVVSGFLAAPQSATESRL